MFRFLLVLTIMFCITLQSVAHIEHYSLDYLRKKEKYKNLEEINQEIVTSSMSDTEITKAIFNWVTHNIKYDCKRRDKSIKQDAKNQKFKKKKKKKRKYLEDYTSVEIVNRGKGICSDYALVFDDLCRINGIESDVISGYARNERNKIGRMFKANHAWNRVKLNDEYYYVDATWSSGYSIDDCKQFMHKPDTAYCLVNEGRFHFDHFPKFSSNDTLHDMAKERFFQYPGIEKGFFLNEIDRFDPAVGVVKIKLDSTVTFSIYSEKNLEDYELYSERGDVQEFGELNYVDHKYEMKFKPIKTGYQFLSIYINGLPSLTYKLYVSR